MDDFFLLTIFTSMAALLVYGILTVLGESSKPKPKPKVKKELIIVFAGGQISVPYQDYESFQVMSAPPAEKAPVKL